ncbi:hypothetical protein EDC04DRAFT_2600280 [Pisolithus marmoratus]|nr:hypothetical protein EDC04DRAFT_2600280 [Pisolithus marmoratus]
MNPNTHMLSNTLFSNPWQLWCSPKQVEDAQTIHEANLFDDDMSSISDPGNHSNDAIVPTESQMDIVPSATYAQPGIATLVAPSNRVIHAAGQHELLASEHDVDVWRLERGGSQQTPQAGGVTGMEQQIQSGQEQTAQQYEKQFDELRMQFEAEKERELTNIEQHYVQLKKPDNGTKSGSMLSEGHEEETRGKAAPGTLDDQPDPPLVSAMVEAVTKSVETTLRTILESRNHFLRWQENYKIQIEKATEPTHHCDFILEKLGIVQDINFITHISADATDVYAYEHEDGPGPDTDKIAFDLAQNHSSPWNTFILSFLLHKFQLRCDCESWPIRKDDDYVQEILQECYKQLQTLWRNAQPKLTAKGLIKTPAEHEA